MLVLFHLNYSIPAQFSNTVIIPLSPNSDENKISLYIVTTYSNFQVARIKKVVTKDQRS